MFVQELSEAARRKMPELSSVFEESHQPRRGWRAWLIWLSILPLLVASVTGLLLAWRYVCAEEMQAARAKTVAEQSGAERHPVIVRQPIGPPTVDTGLRDARGMPVKVACESCHATRPANSLNRTTADLDLFHQGLKLNHGRLACVACHNAADGYRSLHLADGVTVEYADVMMLCAQCHGPQHRDYQHGSHGGMNGHWDRTRGPQRRNNCIDCHDPHAPQHGQVRPAPGPRDRFLNSHSHLQGGS